MLDWTEPAANRRPAPLLLEVEGLRLLRSGRMILDLPHVSLQTGELLAVIGPNGAGKSSLLQSLALLAPATFGQYRFDGRQIHLPGESLWLRRQMAVLFQQPLLLDTSVLENAASGLRLRGVGSREARNHALEWLERLGVSHLAKRPAHQLSGGEAQRVSLARALATRPRLLMLDEPFASLDVLTRSALLKELRPLLRDGSTTALLVTHDVTEVAHLADRVLVLEAGAVVQEGTPGEVFAKPVGEIAQRMAEMARELASALAPLSQ